MVSSRLFIITIEKAGKPTYVNNQVSLGFFFGFQGSSWVFSLLNVDRFGLMYLNFFLVCCRSLLIISVVAGGQWVIMGSCRSFWVFVEYFGVN